MTKKQFGIIFTLMALIVCVGVLSMKLNENGYNDPTSLEDVLSQNTDNAKADAATDANASQESKDVANNALVQKAKMQDQESRVESEIRNKGYEDAICMINDNQTVKVYVKVEDVLSEENSAVIKKVVEDITTLTDVDITSMK